jgi:hypothetical protein
MIFDTISSDAMVATQHCHDTSTCKGSHFYDVTKSSTGMIVESAPST